ncbi:MAG: AI-2E family transporter [Planctomycetes bacterium]|nr:AI-2E family transporter [Planctomycetota bacterium]
MPLTSKMVNKDKRILSKERMESQWLVTASLVILAAIALAMALKFTRTVMMPFILALFIASIVSPILDFLVIRVKLPRIVAVPLTLVVVVVFMGLMSLLVATAIQNVASYAYPYTNTMQDLSIRTVDQIDHYLSELEGWIKRGVSLEPNEVPEANVPFIEPAGPEDKGIATFEFTPSGLLIQGAPPVDPNTPSDTATAKESLNTVVSQPEQVPSRPADTQPGFGRPQIISFIRQFSENLFKLLENTWKLVLGVIWNTIFVTIFVIFLLSGRDPRKLRSSLYRDIDQKIRRYIVTKLVVSGITGLLVWFTLNHFGLELAVVFGILAFLLNFIPSIGSIISTFLPLPIAVAQFQGEIGTILLVMLIPGIIQLIMGNVVEPKLMGGGLNLHPITILLALSFWGLLWGVVGMFLAAPITAVIRIVLMQFDSLKPLAELLTGKLPFSSAHES